MSKRAMEFLESWVRENVNVDAYQEDDAEAKRLSKQCMAEAEKVGITTKELEEDLGTNLTDYIAGQLESATDAEVSRLSKKEP